MPEIFIQRKGGEEREGERRKREGEKRRGKEREGEGMHEEEGGIYRMSYKKRKRIAYKKQIK